MTTTNLEKITENFFNSLTVEEVAGIAKLGRFCGHWNCDFETIYTILFQIANQKEEG